MLKQCNDLKRRTMSHWIGLASLAGILSTAVVWGTDVFFLTIGRSALRLAAASAATEVTGFLHMYADARMPIWGASAFMSKFLLVLFETGRDCRLPGTDP
jgi:hypothetical protein